MIRSITLSGFRGVVHQLIIDLTKGGKPTSLMVFGRNGTGKSSITDGWEWFHSGSIEHLAREGAMAGSYPSRLPGGVTAPDGFVEVTFDDAAAGTVRQSLGNARAPATSNADGLSWFRHRTTHPCHIRFEDLNRFVYLTKTERFDALANLMGFKAQVELQKQLRRVESKLADELSSARRRRAERGALVATHFKLKSVDELTEETILERFGGLFASHGLPEVRTWGGVADGRAILATRLESDQHAKELKDLEALGRSLDRLTPPDLDEVLESFATLNGAFRAQERVIVADVLLGLYEKGEAAVRAHRAASPTAGAPAETCPLCGQSYEGDLLAHIQTELHALSAVREARNAAERARTEARAALPVKPTLKTDLAQGLADAGPTAGQFDVGSLTKICDEIDELLVETRRELTPKVEAITPESAVRIAELKGKLAVAVTAAFAEKSVVRALVTARVGVLSDDGARARLVEDHARIVRGLELWQEFGEARRLEAALVHCYDEYAALVERYVTMNVDDVDVRFAAISADVDRYFGILEANTDGVAHPALKLLRAQERAVVLEVEFRGDRVSPAYSYLSESQLNSFGLSVFLASVRHINRDFRLVVLDDVVNSFDAHKRPQMIKLLKQEFSDFQVIVLTHDDVWWTQLIDQCPQWTRIRFKRYEPGIGPISEAAKSERESVEAFLKDDEATHAARTLGPMLERKLQALCEAMEVTVTYNTRNEYTLRPLLQCLMKRVKEKLGESHPLYLAAKALEENTTFRNFSAHWKNPASGLTSPEVRVVLEQWLAVESHVLCAKPTCGDLTAWRSDVKHFACGCGTQVLTKAVPGTPPASRGTGPS